MICHSLAANSAAVHVEDVKDLRGPRIFKMRFRKSPRWLCKSRSGRWFPLFFAKDGGLMEMACFSHTHCNICMCVCVFILQKICSSQAQKRDSSKLNACYHKPWLQQCLSSGPSPDATCIYSTLALHDGRKICLATPYLTKQTAIYIYIFQKMWTCHGHYPHKELGTAKILIGDSSL